MFSSCLQRAVLKVGANLTVAVRTQEMFSADNRVCTRSSATARWAWRCALHHRQASHQASAALAARVFGGEEHLKGHAALKGEVITAFPVEELSASAKAPAACASARSDCC